MQSSKNLKLEELTLLKVRLWLVLEYFRNGNFQEFLYWAGGFFSFWTGIPVALTGTQPKKVLETCADQFVDIRFGFSVNLVSANHVNV